GPSYEQQEYEARSAYVSQPLVSQPPALAQEPTLIDRVHGLLGDAASLYADSPWQRRFAQAMERLDGPLVVAIAGRVKAGKSTLLNALVGRAVAATDAGECTRVVTW